MTHATADRPSPVEGPTGPEPPRPADLGALADLCVKCGLCLPHCPTYRRSRREGDSPRGRIALIQGLAAGRLEADDTLAEHVSGCLTCRSCETVCPARVPYGEIADRGRALIRAAGRRSEPGVAPLGRLTRHPRLLGQASRLLALARRSGLSALARQIAPRHWLTRVLALAPAGGSAPAAGEVFEPAGPIRGEVSLFLGCVTPGLDGAALAASVRAATALGFRVRVPAGQGCCGALDLHDGRPDAAAAAARRNGDAFGSTDGPILCAATGCAVTLAEVPPSGPGKVLAGRVREVTDFLDGVVADQPLQGPPEPQRIAVHTSCTARLLPDGGEAATKLLSRIPNVEVVGLTAARCCGAAGHHFITRPRQAADLRAPLLEELDALAPDRIASANTGCGLHLREGIRDRRPVPVEHPVAILARALTADW